MTNNVPSLAWRLILIFAMLVGIVVTLYGAFYIVGIALSLISITGSFIYCIRYKKQNKLALGGWLRVAFTLVGVAVALLIISPFIFSNDLRGLSAWAVTTISLVISLVVVLSIELLNLKSVQTRRK